MNPYAPSEVQDLEKASGANAKAGRAARWFGTGLLVVSGAFIPFILLGSTYSVMEGARDFESIAGFTWLLASALSWVVAGLAFRRHKPWRWFCFILPALLFIALAVVFVIWSPE